MEQPKLTMRDELFVASYVSGKTAKASAIAAGYSANKAKAAAYLLLRKPAVIEAIDAAREEVSAEARYGLKEAVAEADRLMKQAEEDGQHSAVASLFQVKCKLFGFLTEKIQVEHRAQIDLTAALTGHQQNILYGPLENVTDVEAEPVPLALPAPADPFN